MRTTLSHVEPTVLPFFNKKMDKQESPLAIRSESELWRDPDFRGWDRPVLGFA